LRPVFRPAETLGITILFYGALIIVGIIVNCVVLGVICKRKLHLTDNIHVCVLNLTVAFLMQLLMVVPLSLFAIMSQNWVLGTFICYICPIIQDIPTYCITLTLLVLCLDRHQSIRHPELGPLPMHWILGLVWAIAFALVLPYMAYIKHYDLSILGPLLTGVEICIISLSGTASRYIKVLFILCYVVPVVLIILLLSCTSYHIRRREKAQSALQENEETAELINQQHQHHHHQQQIPNETPPRGSSHFANRTSGISTLTSTTTIDNAAAVAAQQILILDIGKEKRSERFLLMVTSIYFTCLLPLNVLKCVRQVVTETVENNDLFDIVYIIIVWFAFLPTVLVPWFIAHWLLIGALRKEDRFLPYLNNGSHSTNGHHQQRRHSTGHHFEQPNVPSISRSTVNETIMVHDLGQATSAAPHRRPSDHPTPGKVSKRPSRTKSTMDNNEHQVMLAADCENGQSLLALTSVGRRRSHCTGYQNGSNESSTRQQHLQIEVEPRKIRGLHEAADLSSLANNKKCCGHLLEPFQSISQPRRHSSFNSREDFDDEPEVPPPPPPHKGTVV